MFHKKGRAAAAGFANPGVNPDIFGRLQPELDAACDEMIRSGARVPTKELLEQSTHRVYNNVTRKYPDIAEFARAYDRNFPLLRGETLNILGVEVQAYGAFFGLLAFLLLAGFFFRRRGYRR